MTESKVLENKTRSNLKESTYCQIEPLILNKQCILIDHHFQDLNSHQINFKSS